VAEDNYNSNIAENSEINAEMGKGQPFYCCNVLEYCLILLSYYPIVLFIIGLFLFYFCCVPFWGYFAEYYQ